MEKMNKEMHPYLPHQLVIQVVAVTPCALHSPNFVFSAGRQPYRTRTLLLHPNTNFSGPALVTTLTFPRLSAISRSAHHTLYSSDLWLTTEHRARRRI